jgi:cell division GTPase FtsZ
MTTTTGVHPTFSEALREMGLDDLHTRVRRFPDATRTAAEAAAAKISDLQI